VVVLAGGVLVCVPGFISDALGLLLLFGPVRHLLIRVGGRSLARRVQTMGPMNWSAIDVRAWPASGDAAATTEPGRPMIEREGRRTP
jgi:UPF0716 family protein affecting phage T7 exclusion